ncbi:hypothetical protein V8E36_005568 [Tilletia maclaganii]
MSALTSSAPALAALEPFLLLAKSARGAAAVKLIEQATSAPGCYVFSELLDVEGIKQLATSEHAPAYHLLEIFAYGTLTDYLAAAGPGSSPPLPPLSDAQRTKLQRLTLVTHAGRARVLDYYDLALALGVGPSADSLGAPVPSSSTAQPGLLSEANVRELEDIIIEAIYAGVLSGKLNQKLRRFEVEAAMGRDVKGGQELAEVSSALQAWSSTAEAVLAQLSQRINDARATARRAVEQKQAHEGEIARVLYQLYDHAAGGRRGGDRSGARKGKGEDGDAMEVDAEGGPPGEGSSAFSQGRNRKKTSGGSHLARHKRSRA